MTDVKKIGWFKGKLIVWGLKYLANKSIDESTIKEFIHGISEFFSDKDEKQVLRAINILSAKVQSGIESRFKEFIEGEVKAKVIPLGGDKEAGRRDSKREDNRDKRINKLLRRSHGKIRT